jgi:hypothetical protein
MKISRSLIFLLTKPFLIFFDDRVVVVVVVVVVVIIIYVALLYALIGITELFDSLYAFLLNSGNN